VGSGLKLDKRKIIRWCHEGITEIPSVAREWMGLHIVQMSEYLTIRVMFLCMAAVLIFIMPLLGMLVMKYARGHESFKWLMDLNAVQRGKTPQIHFVPF
jgi:hypothetical protein